MQKRGATNTANGRAVFTTALNQLVEKINQALHQIQSRPVLNLTDYSLTATLLSKVTCELVGHRGGSFYASLFETLVANFITTEDSPESLRQAIAGFAMSNGDTQIAQDFSLLNLLEKHLACSLTMEDYLNWWQDKRHEEPLAHIPFVIVASCMLNTQIVLWTESVLLKATYIFTPPEFNRQFHFVVDRDIYHDPNATMERILDYSYLVEGSKGWEYHGMSD
jgi:hypothetical protein